MFKVDAFSDENYNTLYVTDFEEVFFEVYQVKFGSEDYLLEGKAVNGLPVVTIDVENKGKLEVVLKKGQPRLIVTNNLQQEFVQEQVEVESEPLPSIVPTFEYVEEEVTVSRKPLSVQAVSVPEVKEVVVEKQVIKEVKVGEAELYKYIDERIEAFKDKVTGYISDIKDIELNVESNLEDLNTKERELIEHFTEKVQGLEAYYKSKIGEDEIYAYIESKIEVVKDAVAKQILDARDLTEKVDEHLTQAQLLNQQTTDGLNAVSQHRQTLSEFVESNIQSFKQEIEQALNLQQSASKTVVDLEQQLAVIRVDVNDCGQQLQELAGKVEQGQSLISETEQKLIQQFETKIKSLEENFNTLLAENVEVIEEKAGATAPSDNTKGRVTKKDLNDLNTQIQYIKRVLATVGGGSVAVQYANGGTMNGDLNVNGRILSGGIDISTFFGTGSGGVIQTLSFNEANANLTISLGNTVSLSALSGVRGSDVSGLTANWQSTYTTVSSNSAYWQSAWTVVNANSAEWTTSEYLSGLKDVSIPSPTNGQVLTYNSSLNKWVAGSGLSATGTDITGYYGSFYDERNQTLTDITSAYIIPISGIYEANGVSLTNNNRVTVQHTGTYYIEYSIQFQNTGNTQEDIDVWLRKNGNDLAISNSIYTIQAKKDNNTPGKLIAVTPIILTLSAGDYIQVVWNAQSTDVSVLANPIQTNPTIPSSPSIIVSVAQIANTQLIEGVNTFVQNNSATIIAVDSLVLANSAYWQSAYTTLSSLSSTWVDVGTSSTANYITKWSDSNTITDSSIRDTGTQVTISNPLSVSGGLYASSLSGNGASITGIPKKYSTSIGNNSSLSFTVTHNLNTRDIITQVYDNITYDVVFPTIVNTDANNITITFSQAPSLTGIRVVVIG